MKVKMSSYTFFSFFFTGRKDGKKDKEKKERENLEKERNPFMKFRNCVLIGIGVREVASILF